MLLTKPTDTKRATPPATAGRPGVLTTAISIPSPVVSTHICGMPEEAVRGWGKGLIAAEHGGVPAAPAAPEPAPAKEDAAAPASASPEKHRHKHHRRHRERGEGDGGEGDGVGGSRRRHHRSRSPDRRRSRSRERRRSRSRERRRSRSRDERRRRSRSDERRHARRSPPPTQTAAQQAALLSARLAAQAQAAALAAAQAHLQSTRKMREVYVGGLGGGGVTSGLLSDLFNTALAPMVSPELGLPGARAGAELITRACVLV